jgi:hypothetical protein
MARIITPALGAEMKLHCPHCGCYAAFEYRDFHLDDVGHGIGDHVVCPECRRQIRVLGSDLPPSWEAQIAREETGH